MKIAAQELWAKLDRLTEDELWILMFKLPIGELKDIAIIYQNPSEIFDYKEFLRDVRIYGIGPEA